MKLLTEEQVAAHDAATKRGVIEGTVVSGVVGLAGSWYMHRKWPTYRRLPLSLKTLGMVILVAPCMAIQAERRGLEYDRSQWEGESLRVIDKKELQEERRWQGLSIKDKVIDWSLRHQYTIIMGGWATSLALAGAIISRQRYQTNSQKIVQARMWAQGLTIGLLIAAGALAQTRGKGITRGEQHDHSWQDILEQQRRDKLEAEGLGIQAKPHSV